MEIVKTRAIPLRSVKHSESSRIIKFFTEESGKVSLLAKGARKGKNRVPMDTFSLMNIVFNHKLSREIQILTNAELENAYLRIRDNMAKVALAFGICELVERTTEVEDPNPLLFKLMVYSLEGLNNTRSNPKNYFWFFQYGLINALGFGIDIEKCLVCESGVEDNASMVWKFSLLDGGLVCSDCAKDKDSVMILKPETIKALEYLSHRNLEKLGRLKISQTAGKELDKLFLGFLRSQVEGFKTFKSRELIYKI